MSDLYLNKLAFCALATGLLMTGLNEASHAAFPVDVVMTGGYPVEPQVVDPIVPQQARDYHALFASADTDAGKAVSSKCAACHHLEQGADAFTGPPLFGVVGRKIASVPGFKYSAGPLSLGERSGKWTYEALDRFLENPRKVVPQTAMMFVGIKRPVDRINLIAYLRTLTSGEPEPLP